METIKLARVEVTRESLEKAIAKGEIYLAHYKRIYQIHYSKNGGYSTTLLYEIPSLKNRVPFLTRGHFSLIDGETVNRFMGTRFVDETIRTL